MENAVMNNQPAIILK